MRNMHNWDVRIYDGKKFVVHRDLTKLDALRLFDRIARDTSKNVRSEWVVDLGINQGDKTMATMTHNIASAGYTYYIRTGKNGKKTTVTNDPYTCVEGYGRCEWIRKGCGTRRIAWQED